MEQDIKAVSIGRATSWYVLILRSVDVFVASRHGSTATNHISESTKV